MPMSAWIIAPVTVSFGLLLLRRYLAAKRQAQRLENYQTAIRILDQMILRDPTNAMAFWQKGEVYEIMGMPDRALKHYQVAHRMCPRAYSYHDYSDAYERIKGNPSLKPASKTLTFN